MVGGLSVVVSGFSTLGKPSKYRFSYLLVLLFT